MWGTVRTYSGGNDTDTAPGQRTARPQDIVLSALRGCAWGGVRLGGGQRRAPSGGRRRQAPRRHHATCESRRKNRARSCGPDAMASWPPAGGDSRREAPPDHPGGATRGARVGDLLCRAILLFSVVNRDAEGGTRIAAPAWPDVQGTAMWPDQPTRNAEEPSFRCGLREPFPSVHRNPRPKDSPRAPRHPWPADLAADTRSRQAVPYSADGYVAGNSPRSQSPVRSSGSTARVTS